MASSVSRNMPAARSGPRRRSSSSISGLYPGRMNPPFRLLAPHPTMCCSNTVTSSPRRASVLAAERPVYPPPMITTSLEAGSGERGMVGSGAVSVQRQRSIIRSSLP